jgi:hypothetical protein
VTFWAGLGAVRADLFAAAGGFDATRFPASSIEDVELGLRLTSDGARILLDPAVRGTHLKDWTIAQMLRTDLLLRGVPWVRLLAERKQVPAALNLGLRERASAVAALLAAGGVIARRPGPALGGIVALVALNAPFYRVLVGRLGVARAAACVPLHAAHHLAGAISVPIGLAGHLRSRRTRRSRGHRDRADPVTDG